MFLLRDSGKKKLQHFPKITDYGCIYNNIFVDFRCIYINLQDLCLWCKGLGITGYTVAETCSKSDQKIALTHRIVGSFGAVHSHRACIKLILTGESTFSHKAVTYRCLDLMRQGTNLF